MPLKVREVPAQRDGTDPEEDPGKKFEAGWVSIWVNTDPLELVDDLFSLGRTIAYINKDCVAMYHNLWKAWLHGMSPS